MAEDQTDRLEKKYSKGLSYLYWPVTLYGIDKELHVTAKFLGDIPVDVEAVKKLLDGADTSGQGEYEWKPWVFDSKNDGPVQVLLLTKFPPNLKKVHDALESLRKDDYEGYKAHITVPESDWDMINDEHLEPEDFEMEVGDLTLKSDGKVLHVWKGETE